MVHLKRQLRICCCTWLFFMLVSAACRAADSPTSPTSPTSPVGLSTSELSPEYFTSLRRYRDNVDFRFGDRILSPLSETERISFVGLRYFAVAPDLVLPASFEAAADTSTFAMPTFNRKTLSYSHYGTLTVRIDGEIRRLKAFRREQNAGAPDFLLVPFRDLTNADESYAGGRYLEMALPLAAQPVLDFNRAMNPLCAYDPSYACPIPPPENRLVLPIRAGEKRYR